MKKTNMRMLACLLAGMLLLQLMQGCTQRFTGRSKLDQLQSLVDNCFIGEYEREKAEDAAAAAYIGALGDRWSYYIPAKDYATYEEKMENVYVGVGITITQREDDSGLEIVSVVPGGPAEKAGIQLGDLIVAVDGTSTVGLTTTETGELVGGEEGTAVEITLVRAGETLTLSVTRSRIETAVASGQMLQDHIGLIQIFNFDARCAEESIAAIEELQKQGATKLIFDVRFNPGGYSNELVSLLDYLLPEGDLLRTVDYQGNESVEVSDSNCLDIPMAVLINEDSYSAAEFFAAALSEYGYGITVGEKTVGKGYFQSTIRLRDGSAVGLSIGKYFTPNGKSLAGVGIEPDIPVDVDIETAYAIYMGTLDPAEDPQVQAAVQALLEK